MRDSTGEKVSLGRMKQVYEDEYREKLLALVFDYGDVIEVVADRSYVDNVCDLDDFIREWLALLTKETP